MGYRSRIEGGLGGVNQGNFLRRNNTLTIPNSIVNSIVRLEDSNTVNKPRGKEERLPAKLRSVEPSQTGQLHLDFGFLTAVPKATERYTE